MLLGFLQYSFAIKNCDLISTILVKSQIFRLNHGNYWWHFKLWLLGHKGQSNISEFRELVEKCKCDRPNLIQLVSVLVFQSRLSVATLKWFNVLCPCWLLNSIMEANSKPFGVSCWYWHSIIELNSKIFQRGLGVYPIPTTSLNKWTLKCAPERDKRVHELSATYRKSWRI